MNQLMQDINFAVRQLRKSPGFTFTAILTLALGIGANAAIFTLVHAVLLQNLPISDPKTLIRVGDTDDCCVNGGTPDANDYSLFSYDLYRHLRDNTPEFDQLAAMQSGTGYGSVTASSSQPGALPKALSREYVSGNYFQTLGIKPYAGRLLAPTDDVDGAPMAAVMSYQTWQRDYAADPNVVGSTFTLNTNPVTIIGITPPAFYGDRMTSTPPDFYLPMVMEPVMAPSSLLHKQELNWVYLLGRIKPGTQLAPLQAKMSGSLRGFLSQLALYKRADEQKNLAQSHVILTPGGIGIANMQQRYGKGLKFLMWTSALVLLIACANIANLVLVRGIARRAETSIRIALGAQRKRLIRQTLTESVVLSCIGGLAGLAVAYAGTKLLLAMAFPRATNLPIHGSPSPAVLAFAFALSLITGLIFGIAPAWITSHSDPAEALRGANRSTSDKSGWVQRSLVVLQAALSLILLVGAGLMAKSLNNLENQNFGVETENRIVIHINPDTAGYKTDQLEGLYRQIDENLRALPGVQKVALSLYTPLEGNNYGEGVYIQGRPEPGANARIGASWVRIGPEFFDIVGHHVLRGRGITEHDTATSVPVAVVNQAFVKKFFTNGEDPIGVHFGVSGVKSSGDFEIVGVVSDVKYNDVRNPTRAMYFRPLLQVQHTDSANDTGNLFAGAIMLQTKGPIDNLESQVRRSLASINPNLTVSRYDTFSGQIKGQFNQERLIARLTLMFSVLALVLSSVGLYGVAAYAVARRTSEIGIRMAMGAGRGNVVSMVLRETMLQAVVGLSIGVPLALLCVRFVQSQLYSVAGHDAGVLSLAIATLVASAFAAGFIPARRAASIDPVKALRTE